jgi:integrase
MLPRLSFDVEFNSLANPDKPHEFILSSRLNCLSNSAASMRHLLNRQELDSYLRELAQVGEGLSGHDLRRTFATRLRAHGVHEYDIQDLLGHSKPGVTTVYARATHGALEAAVEKLIEPIGQVV